MKPTKLIMAMALTLACIVSGCNASDNGGGGSVIPPNTQYDFATLTSTNQSGSIFTLFKANDSSPITYSSTVSLAGKKDLAPGDRLIIAYTTTGILKPYESGPINLLGYIMMNNANSTVTDLEGAWRSDALEMEVLTRTGPYINMQMQLFARDNVTRGEILLVADPNKLDQAVPELFLVYDNPKNYGDNKYLAYASFDITDIWTRPTCRGVKVTYQTTNGIKSTTFDNNDVVKPEPNPID